MSIIPLLENSCFDPEFIATLVAAYEDAWARIEKSGSAFASPRYKRPAQEIIAKRIIEMAQQDLARSGKLEPRGLADDAVNYLSETYA